MEPGRWWERGGLSGGEERQKGGRWDWVTSRCLSGLDLCFPVCDSSEWGALSELLSWLIPVAGPISRV